MPVLSAQRASKEYRCQRCKGTIHIGELYYKRTGRVKDNRMLPWFTRWHKDCHKQ